MEKTVMEEHGGVPHEILAMRPLGRLEKRLSLVQGREVEAVGALRKRRTPLTVALERSEEQDLVGGRMFRTGDGRLGLTGHQANDHGKQA